MTEGVFTGALTLGLNAITNTSGNHLKKIWCADIHHPYLTNIVTKNPSIKRVWKGEEPQKEPDIAWTDTNRKLPDWYCQVKVFWGGDNRHVKHCQALGDFMWSYVDQQYLRERHGRDVEMVFCWAEHASAREEDRYLHFEDDEGEMEFRFEPGYAEYAPILDAQEVRIGNVSFNDFKGEGGNPENYWWDRENAILHPNNVTAVKEMMGTGTNSSYYRMYRQPGCLTLRTEYRQLTSESGNWHAYVHRLISGSLDGTTTPLFEWFP